MSAAFVQAANEETAELMTEQEFLAHVKSLVDGSDTTIEMDLALIAKLDAQASRFSDDTQRQLNRIKCWYLYVQKDADEELFIATQLELARAAGDRQAEADFLNCQSTYLFFHGDPDAALANNRASMQIAYEINDVRLIADGFAARGEINSYLGNLAAALEDLLQAQAIYDELNLPYYSAYNLSVVANTYRRMQAYQQALTHYDKLYVLYKDAVNREAFQDIRLQQAMIYQDMGQLRTALEIVLSVYQFYEDKDDQQGLASASTYLASIYNDLGEYQTALDYALEAEQRADNPDIDPQLNRLYLGQAYSGLNQLEQALGALSQAKASFEREDNLRFLSWLYRALAEVYAKQSDWQKAHQQQRLYSDSLISLTEKQNEQHSARLRVEFDLKQARNENHHLKQQQELADARLKALAKAARWQSLTMVLGLLLLMLIAAIGVRFFIQARRMQTLALTDPLTELPNRRHIEEAGQQMLRRSRTYRQTCSLLVMDIDHFKQINDNFGHEIGDKVLQRLAQVSQATLRIQDVMGRSGGEEFIVLLPATNLRQALVIAERLRQAIEQMDASDLGASLAVTTSIGAAQMHSPNETLNQLTTRADNALYAAKAAGRNKVEAAN